MSCRLAPTAFMTCHARRSARLAPPTLFTVSPPVSKLALPMLSRRRRIVPLDPSGAEADSRPTVAEPERRAVIVRFRLGGRYQKLTV